MSSARSFVRAALCVLALSSLTRCAPRRDVLVRLRPLPEDASAIELMASRGEADAERVLYEGERVRDVAAQRRDVSLVLSLPSESDGPLALAAAVYSQDGCLIALGESAPVDVALGAAASEALLDLAEQRCPARRAADGAPILAEVRAGDASAGPLSADGGAPLTIRGFGFARSATVTLDGEPVPVTRASLLQLEGRAPPLKAPMGRRLLLSVRNGDSAAATWDRLRAFEPRIRFSDPLRRQLMPPDAAPGARFLAAGDVDGDDRADLVAGWALRTDGLLHVLYGGEDFASPRAIKLSGVNLSWNFALADFDRDGRADLAVVDIQGTQGSVHLRPNRGVKEDPFPVELSQPLLIPGAQRVEAADVDGDTRPDLLVTAAATSAAGSLTVLLNQGAGQFSLSNGAAASCALELNSDVAAQLAFNLPIGDIDGDGRFEPVFGSGTITAPALVPYPMDPRGRCRTGARSSLQGLTPSRDWRTALGDVDGDGRADLVIASGGKLHLVLNDGAGRVGPIAVPFSLSVASDPDGTALNDMLLADVNGDSASDLIVTSYNNGAVGNRAGALTVWLNQRAGPGRVPFADTPQARLTMSAALIPSSPVVADLNGDGRPDLAVVTGDNDRSVLIYYNQPEVSQ